MFGGEYYDGKKDKMHVFNDLFMYHPEKNTWTQIMSPHGSVSAPSWKSSLSETEWTCMTHLRASFTKVPCYQNFLQIRSYIRFLHDQASTQKCSPGSSPQALSVHLWGRADVSEPGNVRIHHFNPVRITALKQLNT